MRPPFFILSSSRRVRKTVHWYLGQNRQPGTEEQTRRFQKKIKIKILITAEARVSTAGRWFVLSRDRRAAHPGTRARDATGRKDSGASSPLSFPPTALQSSIFLSLPFPPPPCSPHLPSPISPASQPAPVQPHRPPRWGRKQPFETLREQVPLQPSELRFHEIKCTRSTHVQEA